MKLKSAFFSKLYITLLKAYVFGDRFIAPTFRAAVSAEFARRVNDLVADPYLDSFIDVAHYAYKNLRADSIVLQCLIDAVNEHCFCFTIDDQITRLQALRQLPPAILCRTRKVFSEMIVVDDEADKARQEKEEARAALLTEEGTRIV